MKPAAVASELPRASLIALAPFLLLYIGLGIADSFRPDKPDTGYATDRDLQLVVLVHPGGPAERAGFRVGDRILAINDVPATRFSEIVRMTARVKVGEPVAYRLERDGQAVDATLVTGADRKSVV